MPSLRLCFAAVVVAASLAACGSSSTPSTSTPTSSSPTTNASGPATVKVISVSGYGKALGTASGKALYMLSTDPSNGSKCSASCASTWPPLTVTGAPVAGSGVSGTLSSFKRSDGSKQVSLNGHALYTFTGGAVEDAIAEDGGVWYLVSPSGAAIKHTVKNNGY